MSTQIKSIVPFGEQVLCKEVEASLVTRGGLFLPSTAISKTNQGTVMEFGPLCDTKNCNVGDVIFFPMHSEARLEFADQKFILVPQSAILGAIREVK